MSDFRDQLLAMHRQMYKRNMRLINKFLSFDEQVAKYAREYNHYLKSFESISSKSELIYRILSSDVVYHGDYHTLKQSQRCVLRVLREITGKREIILCLEMFHSKDQKFVDKFVAGKLSEHTFLKKINYAQKWEYKWEYWRPLILFAMEHALPIIGINSDMSSGSNSLRSRDYHAAQIITKLILRNPGKLVYVVDGDYHISPNHLPKEVDALLALLDEKGKRTIIYQNVENLYWQLAEEKKEEADVLQISQDSYCIMNTTPANKLQSYLNWMEYSDDAWYPINSDWGELAEADDSTTIPEFAKKICALLGLPFPRKALQHMTIYYSTNLEFMSMISQSEELAHMLPFIKRRIKNGEGFLLEYDSKWGEAYLIYLANSSTNMAAEEAAHFINAALRGPHRNLHNSFDLFYFYVIIEMLGFFGSKLINEKRKSLSSHALRTYLGKFKNNGASPEEQEKIDIAHLILQHHYLEKHSKDPEIYQKKFSAVFRPKSSRFVILSTQLGYMAGNRLFTMVRKGLFPLDEVRDLFKKRFDEPFKAFQYYLNISERLRNLRRNHARN